MAESDIRDYSEFLEGGVVLLLRGVTRFLQGFRGRVWIFYKGAEGRGGFQFLICTKKKNRIWQNAPFGRFTPPILCDLPLLPWKSSFTLGVPIFDGVSEGGYAFFTATFPEKYHPPHKKFWTVPYILMVSPSPPSLEKYDVSKCCTIYRLSLSILIIRNVINFFVKCLQLRFLRQLLCPQVKEFDLRDNFSEHSMIRYNLWKRSIF